MYNNIRPKPIGAGRIKMLLLSEAQHGDLGVIQPDDVMLLISNSGKTREIIDLVHLTHNLYYVRALR